MTDSIGRITKMLGKTISRNGIDWNTFGDILSSVEDINIFDNESEETILSELLGNYVLYHNGSLMPDIIRSFIKHGYDVHANDGINGGLCLSQLCWSSYDKYVLDAAKVLLDAGAPINYASADDIPDDDEPNGVLGSISWKLSGLWDVDGDYSAANIFEAYYSMIMAVKDGKDYREISSYLDCIGLKLEKVSATVNDCECRYWTESGLIKYSGDLFMWFAGKPLKISKYVDFVIDPVHARENENKAIDVSKDFTDVIGARLVDVKFIDQSICCFDFENENRIVFTGLDIRERNRIGSFEIRESNSQINFERLNVKQICMSKDNSYANHVDHYNERSIALYTDEGCVIVFPVENGGAKYSLDSVIFSENIAVEYTQLLPVGIPKEIKSYHRDGKISAIRFRCEEGYLYFGTTEHNKIEVLLSDEAFNPNEYINLLGRSGKHMKFSEK